MKEITDIWFKTDLRLETLTKKLNFELEVYDCENVWEWTISSFENAKLDICRDHTKKRAETYTNIFRLDERKKPFSEDLINHIVTKLKSLNITPIYLGQNWINKDDVFEGEIIKKME